MMLVEKLYGVKSAAINVKVDVPLFKIRCVGLPDFRVRMPFLDGLPDSLADALALRPIFYEEKSRWLR